MRAVTTLALGGLLAGFAGPCWAAPTEAEMSKRLCADFQREVVVKSGARVDCLTADYAIEIDFTEKWAEAIGQALDYAHETGRKPGAILICRQSEIRCLGHVLRFQATLAFWGLPVTLWRCDTDSQTLADCLLETRN